LAIGLLVLVGGAALFLVVAGVPWGDQPTLLFFRSDHCVYCEELAPVVNRLRYDHLGALRVVYVDVENADSEELIDEYGVFGTPTIVLLDREGEVSNVLRGTFAEPVLERAVEELMEEEAAPPVGR
jgi:thiol-disulfide isomerase/thioredoxin